MRIVVHVSGFDSYILFKLLQEEYDAELIPVFYDYGQVFAKKELKYIKEILPVEVIKLRGIFDSFNKDVGGVYDLSGRNAILFITSAIRLSPDKIAVGSLAEDFYEDSKPNHYFHLSSVASAITGKWVEALNILHNRKFTKETLLNWGLDNIEPHVLESLPSCMDVDKFACGACSKCIERWKLFTPRGLKYPMFETEESIEAVISRLLFPDGVELRGVVCAYLDLPSDTNLSTIIDSLRSLGG